MGVYSGCLIGKVVVDLERQTGRCEHPRFLFVGNKEKRIVRKGAKDNYLENKQETDKGNISDFDILG